MVKYNHDAWGNWINKETLGQNALGNELVSINPFIYKGYIYDEETDFYYLKSRYYSPKIRRFINVDSEIALIAELENSNLFAYCTNNPIMFFDENGNWSKWWKALLVVVAAVAIVATVALITVATGGLATPVLMGAAIGSFIGGTTSIVTQLIKTGTVDFFQVAVDAAIGGIMGALGGSPLGRIGMSIAGGITNATGELINQLESGEGINGFKIFLSGAMGALFSAIGGPGAQHGKLTNRIKFLKKYKDPNYSVRMKKHHEKQLNKFTWSLKRSAMRDIKRSVPWDVFSSIIDGLL